MHKKLQQFFAAKWMLQNRGLDGIESALNDKTGATIKPGVLIFIAGLLGEDKDDKRLLPFLKIFTKSVSTTFVEDSCYCEEMDAFLACVAEAWNEKNAPAILPFCEGFEPFKKLQTFSSFPSIMTCGAANGLSLLMRKLRIEKLHLSGILIFESVAKIIASKCLENNSMIKCVNFSHCCLSSNAMIIVCQAFMSMGRLEDLDLSCCNIGKEGLKLLAEVLQHGLVKSLQLGSQYERVTTKVIMTLTTYKLIG